MKLFDTDTFTLLNAGNPRIRERAERETEEIAISIITRIEVLLGRFDFMLKAADGDQLARAQNRFLQSDQDLANLKIIHISSAMTAIFDRLRLDKKLKKIGRADLLIACIALANQAVVVTRNVKHFRQVPGLRVENLAD